MTLSAHQPAYLPWLGYYHKMSACDLFVFLDDVQYSRGDFINRNRIKTPQGAQWLTVPVHCPNGSCTIYQARTVENNWRTKHEKSIRHNYGVDYKPPMYDRLASICISSVLQVADLMEFDLPNFARLSEFRAEVSGYKDDLLISLCKLHGADRFVFGAMGRTYYDREAWERAGIEPVFQEFHTPEYSQRYGEFIPNLSAIDAIFNIGTCKTKEIIRSGKITS